MKKKTYIEFLRIIACLCVPVAHTNAQIFTVMSFSKTWFCSVAIFLVTKTLPLFLFITGALLLGREDTAKKSAMRVWRAVVVLTVSSLLYHLYYVWRHETPYSIWQFFYRLPQTHITNAFWYLYLYVGLMCMMPVLQKLARALDKRHMEYFLLLCLVIPGTVPLFSPFHMAKYFEAALIAPYIGQVMLGYYIERYVPVTRRTFRVCLCGLVGIIALDLGLALAFYARDGAEFYHMLEDSTLITVTAAAACSYICAKYIFTVHTLPPRAERALCAFGKLTFGIYLLGDMAISFTQPVFSALCGRMHVLCALVLWDGLIIAGCALITALLRCVPPLRKWI